MHLICMYTKYTYILLQNNNSNNNNGKINQKRNLSGMRSINDGQTSDRFIKFQNIENYSSTLYGQVLLFNLNNSCNT